MDRRLLGATTVVVVLVAVAVLSAAGGRRVAGSAAIAPPVPPPAVGTCLLQPLPTGLGPGNVSPVPLGDLTLGPCSGAVFGQVVGLLPIGPTAIPGSVLSTGDCAATAAAFAGLLVTETAATAPGDPADDPIHWRPTIGARFHTVVPSRWAPPTGPEWMACLATPTRPESFTGTLSGSFTAGSLPDQFGLCWAGTDLDGVPALLPCDEPHPAELLATGWMQDRSVLTPDEMAASCRTIAGLLLRTDDPTRSGLLEVVMDPVRRDGALNPNDPLVIGCFIRATGPHLTGSVIGLGAAPVPLAG